MDTTTDAQCHLSGPSSCRADEGYNPATCKLHQLKCLSATAKQCKVDAQCRTSATGRCVNTVAGESSLYCRRRRLGGRCGCVSAAPRATAAATAAAAAAAAVAVAAVPGDEEEDGCPICMEPFGTDSDETVGCSPSYPAAATDKQRVDRLKEELNCANMHKFHKGCLERTCAANPHKACTCPICRTSFKAFKCNGREYDVVPRPVFVTDEAQPYRPEPAGWGQPRPRRPLSGGGRSYFGIK